MKALTLIKPYDDDSLVWNNESQRYELTVAYCKDTLDATFKNDEELKRRIKKNTRAIYSYINLHTATVNKPVVDFLLKRTEQGRRFLLEILSVQMEADSQSGYNDLTLTPAISFTGGQDKDRNLIRQNAICVAAEDLFINSNEYFGVRLGFMGQFPPYYFLLVRDNL